MESRWEDWDGGKITRGMVTCGFHRTGQLLSFVFIKYMNWTSGEGRSPEGICVGEPVVEILGRRVEP